MDASQYKDFVLVLLFVKYVSDKYANDSSALIEVPPGGGFVDMVALRGKKNIGEGINTIVAKLAEANELRGVIDVADFNDPDKLGTGQEMVERLSNLVGIFSRPEFSFGGQRADGDDLLGDAYEYLMRNFATQSGKSKGQFYTPAEVSQVIAKVIGVGAATSPRQTIYDPTCGSGSLLLKAHDEAPCDLTIYGQERDVATRALAKMNMVLHGCPTAEIQGGNTLSAPAFTDALGRLKTHDFVVANPPFSDKAWSQGVSTANDPYRRFIDGVPPAKNGDYAFLLHIVASLKSTGTGAIVLPHGVLFRGNAEGEIRRRLVERGIIKGVIGLPANLFYGTGIPACIVVLDKVGAGSRDGIHMIDASRGYIKDGNKNRLRAQDIHRIVDAFNRQADIPGYARLVPWAEITANDTNLNIPRYVNGAAPEDLQDIGAHLYGGIPDRDLDLLQPFWDVLPSVRAALFGVGDRPGYASPLVPAAEVKAAILGHPEFIALVASAMATFDAWREDHLPRLRAIAPGDKPKALIAELSEDLLARFAGVPLLDPYSVYQHLMTYWAEVMGDDTYILVSDGWAAARTLRDTQRNSEGKLTEEPDLVLGTGRAARRLKADLVPPALVVARFFSADQTALDALEAAVEEAARALEEFDEEHAGEDGLLAEARTDSGKLAASGLRARLHAVKTDPDAKEERAVLVQALHLIDALAQAEAAAKAARVALEARTAAHYAVLADPETQTLVIEDKWMATVRAQVAAEVDRVGARLTGRVRVLAERYAWPLPTLTAEARRFDLQVAEHLRRMGLAA